MSWKLGTAVQSVNDALFPGPNKNNNEILAAFGGQSTGFASDLANDYAKYFYTQGTEASADTVFIPQPV